MALKPLGKTTAPRPKTHKPIYNPSLALQGTKEGKKYLQRIRDMTPYQRLIYWITERHRVHCKRYQLRLANAFGKPQWVDEDTEDSENFPTATALATPTDPPWTDDPILQTIFFCNPFRENDKVTAYLRDNFREEFKDKTCVFLGTILLRMFNYIPTMRRLINAGIPQRLGTSPKECRKALTEAGKLLVPLRDAGEQMFGGAYIIKFFNGMRKVEAGLQIMGSLAELTSPADFKTMGDAAKTLIGYKGMGPFYVYQFIGDLAYTYVLKDADDWWTWGFCGPGTSRGLLRLRGITTKPNGQPFERRIDKPRGWEEQLQSLLVEVNASLKKLKLPKMHMRDLCNCLCEFDKYNRALNNERHVKRPYAGR